MAQTLYWLVTGKILPFFAVLPPPRARHAAASEGASAAFYLWRDRALGVALAPPQSERAGEASRASAAAVRCRSWSCAYRHISVWPRGTVEARLPCNTVHMYLVTALSCTMSPEAVQQLLLRCQL